MAINTKVNIGYNYDTECFSVKNPITGEMIYLNIIGGLDETLKFEYSKNDVVSFLERVQKSIDTALKTVGLMREIEYYNSIVEYLEQNGIRMIAENIKKGNN